MRWLLFLSRIAFICNIFFLLAFSLKLTNWIKNQDLNSTVVIIGYFMAALFNPFVTICYLVLAPVAKNKLNIIPRWLIVANILFLIMQIFFILYLNDTQHS